MQFIIENSMVFIIAAIVLLLGLFGYIMDRKKYEKYKREILNEGNISAQLDVKANISNVAERVSVDSNASNLEVPVVNNDNAAPTVEPVSSNEAASQEAEVLTDVSDNSVNQNS